MIFEVLWENGSKKCENSSFNAIPRDTCYQTKVDLLHNVHSKSKDIANPCSPSSGHFLPIFNKINGFSSKKVINGSNSNMSHRNHRNVFITIYLSLYRLLEVTYCSIRILNNREIIGVNNNMESNDKLKTDDITKTIDSLPLSRMIIKKNRIINKHQDYWSTLKFRRKEEG